MRGKSCQVVRRNNRAPYAGRLCADAGWFLSDGQPLKRDILEIVEAVDFEPADAVTLGDRTVESGKISEAKLKVGN